MNEFFQEWRRIVGVVTLVTACVFATAWARSLMSLDVLKISIGESAYCHFHSAKGSFGCCVVTGDALPLKSPTWSARQINGTSPIYSSEIPYGCTSLQYWSKVIPLMLIAAYLLLIPPPKKSPTPYFEHVGTRREYLEICLLAFAVMANAGEIPALWYAIFSS